MEHPLPSALPDRVVLTRCAGPAASCIRAVDAHVDPAVRMAADLPLEEVLSLQQRHVTLNVADLLPEVMGTHDLLTVEIHPPGGSPLGLLARLAVLDAQQAPAGRGLEGRVDAPVAALLLDRQLQQQRAGAGILAARLLGPGRRILRLLGDR